MKKTFAMLLTGIMVWIGATLPAFAGDSRQIKITLDDMFRIHPDRIEVKAGETIDFVVHNSGKLPHEFVFGAEKEVNEHAMEMRNMSGMSMNKKPADNSMREKEEGVAVVDVKPGETAHLLYPFNKRGTLSAACLYPGHRESGMKGFIIVK